MMICRRLLRLTSSTTSCRDMSAVTLRLMVLGSPSWPASHTFSNIYRYINMVTELNYNVNVVITSIMCTAVSSSLCLSAILFLLSSEGMLRRMNTSWGPRISLQ